MVWAYDFYYRLLSLHTMHQWNNGIGLLAHNRGVFLSSAMPATRNWHILLIIALKYDPKISLGNLSPAIYLVRFDRDIRLLFKLITTLSWELEQSKTSKCNDFCSRSMKQHDPKYCFAKPTNQKKPYIFNLWLIPFHAASHIPFAMVIWPQDLWTL